MLYRDAAYPPARHSKNVIQAKANYKLEASLHITMSKDEFIDTSTWEQIIRVLEECSLHAHKDEHEAKASPMFHDDSAAA